jgi:hypothetical protein
MTGPSHHSRPSAPVRTKSQERLLAKSRENSQESSTNTQFVEPITWLDLDDKIHVKTDIKLRSEFHEMSPPVAEPRRPVHPFIQPDPVEPPYRTYKRRWFGLLQLILLNIVVSWDVRYILNEPGIVCKI